MVWLPLCSAAGEPKCAAREGGSERASLEAPIALRSL